MYLLKSFYCFLWIYLIFPFLFGFSPVSFLTFQQSNAIYKKNIFYFSIQQCPIARHRSLSGVSTSLSRHHFPAHHAIKRLGHLAISASGCRAVDGHLVARTEWQYMPTILDAYDRYGQRNLILACFFVYVNYTTCGTLASDIGLL